MRNPFVTGEVYHLMNKSIAGFEIFKYSSDYDYMLKALRYFTLRTPPNKFSYFLKRDIEVQSNGFEYAVNELVEKEGQGVQVIAYCLMPTHFHVLVRQLDEGAISTFMRHTLNTYARYFNIKHSRKGPLWEGSFKDVAMKTDEQLLHVIRYLHLNPTSAGLVNKPEDWLQSSYYEYITPRKVRFPLTEYKEFFDMSPREHKEFTADHQDYQRVLAVIKHQVLE